ncbi:hypothetical protein [Nocardia beijingensis]|uniref:hypothetical protein n=1 Tax=Nocardia beijingensis TaxID=95162 RepID=UPI0033A7E9FB
MTPRTFRKGVATAVDHAFEVRWVESRHLSIERENPFRRWSEGVFVVGVSGRYLKQWERDWLQKVIARIEAAPARRPPSAGSSAVKPRRLDRRLSPVTVAELVEGYQGGASTNRLCEQYELSKGGLLKILQEHGVQMRNQPMTEEEIDWAVQLYGEGQSLNAVARQLGKSKGSVWKALRERGVEMRPATR